MQSMIEEMNEIRLSSIVYLSHASYKLSLFSCWKL